MTKSEMLLKLDEVEKYAQSSKLYRFIKSPSHYLKGILFSKLIYPINKKGKLTTAKTFWNQPISVLLPAAMDIYLCGGKTHYSETRLCKYLLNTIHQDTVFLDIGAHIGFFSLLAAQLAPNGKIIAIEASPNTYQLLKENTKYNQPIIAKNCAISHQTEVIDFLEFPVLFSEFNTLEKEIYANEDWFKKNPSNRIKINAITGTSLLQELQLHPTLIKIDVEGAEEKVIVGLLTYLKQYQPKIIMEFANSKRNNANHSKAEAILFSIGYKAYSISKTGEPVQLKISTSDYIAEQQLESDNIIYLKDM